MIDKEVFHDWKALRNIAAIALMVGELTSYDKETLARMAIDQADELIKQLKERDL